MKIQIGSKTVQLKRYLKVSRCKKGMRVKLDLDACDENNYSIDETNPAEGTEFECEGEIIWIDSGHEEVEVQWDNGCTNVYIDYCLFEVNREGFEGCVEIW